MDTKVSVWASVWALACAVMTSCGGDGGGPAGIACGDTLCSADQVCCIDCDERGLCGAPGTGCPGLACEADGGSPPPIACGEQTCASGQVCCIDCDGSGICGPPGTSCAGAACVEPDAGRDGGSTASNCGWRIGQVCCDPAPGDGPNYCDPGLCCSGANLCTDACGDSSDSGACGSEGAPCCDGTCAGALECCAGVPYPEDGVCQSGCEARSDRALKEDFSEVATQDVLQRLVELPVSRWRYKGDSAEHMGPMAQDFHATFGLGPNDRVIHGVDAQGVLIAAVQALAAQLEESRVDAQDLRRQIEELRSAASSRELACGLGAQGGPGAPTTDGRNTP